MGEVSKRETNGILPCGYHTLPPTATMSHPKPSDVRFQWSTVVHFIHPFSFPSLLAFLTLSFFSFSHPSFVLESHPTVFHQPCECSSVHCNNRQRPFLALNCLVALDSALSCKLQRNADRGESM